MLPETIIDDGLQGFAAKPLPPLPPPQPGNPFPAPWPRPPKARRCQYCGRGPAEIFDIDGCWDTEECQRADRASEMTVWRRWSQ